MANLVSQIRNSERLGVGNLERNEQNDELCKLFLLHLPFNQVLSMLNLDYSPYFGSVESCQVLGEFVKSSKTLEDLSMHGVGMDGDGLSYIIRGLLENPNSVLSRLEIGSNIKLTQRGAELVEELLLRDLPTLTILGIWGPGWTPEEAAPVARALAKNTTLRQLSCGVGYGITHPDRDGPLTYMLRALTPVEMLSSEEASYQDGTYNRTLEALSINYEYEKGLAETLAQMLTNEKCPLKTLGLRFFQFNREQWGELWKALKHNKLVESMDLYRCGQGLGDAFGDLMELLQANRTLKVIQMGETPLEAGGQSALVKQQLERNARLADYLGTLNNKLQFVQPKIGRLFLCGYPRAGKTTLRRSMVGTQGNVVHRAMFAATAYMAKQSCFFPSYFDRRTQGIEIRLLRESGDKHIAVWDLAGQDEYHALHDSHYMFPDINQACVFLFLYSPTFNAKGEWEEESANCLEKELCYWLGFITSNYRKSGWILPQVSVVLTHLDKLSLKFGKDRSIRAERYIQWARTTGKVDELRRVFKGRVDLDEEVHAVNAFSSGDARTVVDTVFKRFDYLFSRTLPPVPAACEEMNLFLAKWTAEKSHRFYPIIKQEKFLELCKEIKELDALFHEVPSELASEEEEIRRAYRKKNELAVASYLHDVGSIIHFPKSTFVVVDPNWLGKVFLGQLFRPGDESYNPIISNTRNGYVSHEGLQQVLEDFIQSKRYRGFTAGDLIRLMKELELCYEETVSGTVDPPVDPPTRSYFIPSTLDDPGHLARRGRRVLKWGPVQNSSTPIYSGLRLQCTDQSRTFLSPGFFQRFQVHLKTYLRDQKFLKYKIEKNLIILQHDGLEILVEKSGEDGLLDGDYVDILVRSYNAARGGKRASLVTDIVEQLRVFCASREGCPGVALQEGILRSRCVKSLSLCCHRKEQAVVKQDLTDAVMRKLFESEELELWEDESYATSVKGMSQIYMHRFPAVPEDDNLGEEDVEAMEMLNVLDIKEAIFKYRVAISEQRYAIFQAVDEVHKVTGADIPSTSRVTTSQIESEVAQVHRDEDRDIPITGRSEGPPEGADPWLWLLGEHERRIKEPIARLLRDMEHNLISTIKEQTAILKRHIELSMEDMQMLHQKLHSTLMEKMDEVMGSTAELQDMPGLPYFSDKNVGLTQRLVAFIQIGQPIRLHFMCESPSQPHYIEHQQGLSLINLLPGDTYKKLRPLILGSIKILFILIKAGLHVAAGIGNAIPDYSSLPGVEPLLATSLTAETIMESIKGISSNSIDSSLAEAWATIQEVMGPVNANGQISATFQLYRVQYKSRMLSRYLSRTSRRCFWLCEKCRTEAQRADLLGQ